MQEMLERYAEEWLGPLRGWAVHWKFRKGFVEEVTVPVQVYLDHAASITQLAPIRRIEVDLSEADIPRAILECIPESVARENVALPIGKRGYGLVVAVRDPADSQTITILKFILNRDIEPVAAPIEHLIHMINRSYDETELESVTTTCIIHESHLEFYDASSDLSPVGRLVNLIIQEAIAMGAKAVHIKPEEDRLRVRYCINGELVERDTPPRRLLPAIVERLRFLSSPNPGRIRGSCQGTPFDFGCDIRETAYGPGVVITM
jgi:type IV pilus assembly protein PilB